MKGSKEINPVMYLCDPTKNTECNKSGCYIHGKGCFLTTNPAYAKDGYRSEHLIIKVLRERKYGVESRKQAEERLKISEEKP